MQLDKPGTEKIRKARDDREKAIFMQLFIGRKIAPTAAHGALER